ncbi:hypothetical protein ACEWY4_026546 [Coilia grayii]|uniref:UBA domain-containing protein n=1 Tax=Coilia grayii TaxID=363190 RepID=A0ABD1IPX3_9TELE
MNPVEEVPLRMPVGALREAKEEVQLVTAPDISVPDYLQILQETEYVCSLENWVLTGLQGGYPTPTQSQAPVPGSPTDVLPSCPPYWMMFSSPQESRLASRWSSDLWEPNPRRRSRSLNASHYRSIDGRVRFTISDSDSEDDDDECQGKGKSKGGDPVTSRPQRFLDLPKNRSISAQLVPPKQQTQQQQRQNLHKNVRQASLTNQKPPRPPTLRSLSLSGYSPSPSNQTSVSSPRKKVPRSPTIGSRKPWLPFSGLCPRPPAVTCVGGPRPLGSQRGSDSSMELLSALSQEERDLVEAITQHGYSLRTAISALQKTREHSSEQILNYLVACDRLCERGYDEAEVEEALEMFQNCETKVWGNAHC